MSYFTYKHYVLSAKALGMYLIGIICAINNTSAWRSRILVTTKFMAAIEEYLARTGCYKPFERDTCIERLSFAITQY